MVKGVSFGLEYVALGRTSVLQAEFKDCCLSINDTTPSFASFLVTKFPDLFISILGQ